MGAHHANRAPRPFVCRLGPVLDKMEEALTASGFEYLACETYTLADLTYACYFELFPPAGLSDLLEARPTLAAWWARCRERAEPLAVRLSERLRLLSSRNVVNPGLPHTFRNAGTRQWC